LEIRKVQKLGTSSLIVTLPKTWVNRLGIKPGDSVYLVEKERELRIVPFHSEGEFTVVIALEQDNLQDSLKLLRCAMQMGFSNIRIKSKSPISTEVEEAVRSVILSDRDFELNKVDPFTFDVVLVNKLSYEDVGAMIREAISLLEKSFSIILEAVESPVPDLVDKLEKIQELFEQRRLTRKHISRIIEGSRGDLIEERRVCTFISTSYNVCLGLNSIHRALVEVVKRTDPLNLVSTEDAESVRNVLSMFLNITWEIIGGLTNESIKRIESARGMINTLMKQLEEVLSKEMKNRSLRDALLLISNSLHYFDMLLNDIYCYIESKKLELLV
jgi:phosphate uptake regulator